MALILKRYRVGSSSTDGTANTFTGVSHWTTSNRPTDVAVIPPVGITTASGDRPATSISFDWDGNGTTGGDPTFVAFQQGDGTPRRAERAMGGIPMAQQEYWLDFWIKFGTTVADSQNGDADWNYIMQHRPDGPGNAPSPSPALGLLSGQMIFRYNIGGINYNGYFNIGSLDKGGGWHHYQVGWYWTVTQSLGWMEAWRDGVNTLPRTTNIRTAFSTSNGGSMRWGGYSDPEHSGRRTYNLWGCEVHTTRPTDVPNPGGGGTDPEPTTRPDLPASPISVAETIGFQTRGTQWFGASANRIRGSVFTLTQTKQSDGFYIPMRGSLTGTGSQNFRGVLYSVSNPSNPASDVKIVEGAQFSVTNTSEAAWYTSLFTERTLAPGTYRFCLHSDTNGVAEMLRNTTGGLYSAADTYAGGASATFGAETPGSIAADTPGVDMLLHVFDAAPPAPGGTIQMSSSMPIEMKMEGNLTELTSRTPISPSDVVYRFTQLPTQYIVPTPYSISQGFELVWDATTQAYYQVSTPPGG